MRARMKVRMSVFFDIEMMKKKKKKKKRRIGNDESSAEGYHGIVLYVN